MLHDRRHRPFIQTDLAVGQIIIIDEEQVRLRNTCQLQHFGARAGNVHLSPADAYDPPVIDLVPANRQTVIPQGATRLGWSLKDRKRSVMALLVEGGICAEAIDAGRLEPLRGPRGQVASGFLLQRSQQVGQAGVTELMPAEVDTHRAQECVDPYVRRQLLEYARPFGVRDSIEVDLDRVQVGNIGCDRMR